MDIPIVELRNYVYFFTLTPQWDYNIRKDVGIVKCAYSKCLHKSKDITEIDNFTKSGNRYFHLDCYQTQQQIQEIKNLFVEYINPNVVFAQLMKVINTIVFDKKLGSDYLLFGLKYYIENKITLNYPQGLYYVIQNRDVKTAYEKRIAELKVKQMKKNTTPIEVVENTSFKYKPKKEKGIEDIFGGV